MKAELEKKFNEIYEGEGDAIFRFCLIRVSSREQALDITQETFLRLWQNLSAEKEIQKMRSFLFTVAHRLIIDWYRKKKAVSLEKMQAQRESGLDGIDGLRVESFEIGSEGRFVLEKIGDLPESFRDAVYLRFVEGLMPEEIAEVLNISANLAGVRVSRGIAELRRICGEK